MFVVAVLLFPLPLRHSDMEQIVATSSVCLANHEPVRLWLESLLDFATAIADLPKAKSLKSARHLQDTIIAGARSGNSATN